MEIFKKRANGSVELKKDGIKIRVDIVGVSERYHLEVDPYSGLELSKDDAIEAAELAYDYKAKAAYPTSGGAFKVVGEFNVEPKVKPFI